MRQTERANDHEEALRAAFDGLSRDLWTCMVGIVTQYDATKGTVQVQPSIESVQQNPDGSTTPLKLAPIGDIPVVYLGGGDFVATFPIRAGDEALVIFADRCIDSWWQSGGVQPPGEPRAHSMSDGLALIGPRSLARKLANVSATAAQLRSIDGATYVEIAAGHVVNVVAPAGINLTGPVTINGNLQLNGTAAGSGGAFSVAGDITASGEVAGAGIHLSTHVHGGVQAGGSDTTGPIG